MREFTEQLNDLIAPVTRAWTTPEIQKVLVEPGALGEDEIIVVATIKLKRKSKQNWTSIVHNLFDTEINREDW